MMLPHLPHAIGIAWYVREDYPHILEIMADGNRFPPSFDAWLNFAEELEIKLSNYGLLVVRVTIEPAAFLTWRAAHGLPSDATSVDLLASEYAFWQMDQTYDDADEDEPFIHSSCFDYTEEVYYMKEEGVACSCISRVVGQGRFR